MNNELLSSEFLQKEFSVVFGKDNDDRKIDPSYFLSHYPDIIFRYISNGNPSADTRKTYISNISNYLRWCAVVKMNPFDVNEQHILYYRSLLVNRGFKATTIKFKLTCVRRFYFVATKYGLIAENPAKDIHAQRNPDAYIPVLKFLNTAQLKKLLSSFNEEDEIDLRTKTIVILMAIEGLRTVEVNRMNVADINFSLGMIYIRGKGHNDMIYPSPVTMDHLKRYLDMRYSIGYSNSITPVFTSTSNRSKGARLSRDKIRFWIDKALLKCGFKAAGNSCHMLRHTCGTLLYAKTKDIQAVKMVLRHRNIEMTSRYSHVQDALLKRYTNVILDDEEK